MRILKIILWSTFPWLINFLTGKNNLFFFFLGFPIVRCYWSGNPVPSGVVDNLLERNNGSPLPYVCIFSMLLRKTLDSVDNWTMFTLKRVLVRNICYNTCSTSGVAHYHVNILTILNTFQSAVIICCLTISLHRNTFQRLPQYIDDLNRHISHNLSSSMLTQTGQIQRAFYYTYSWLPCKFSLFIISTTHAATFLYLLSSGFLQQSVILYWLYICHSCLYMKQTIMSKV